MERSPMDYDYNENLRFGPGWIFDPTDEHLVNYYLKEAVLTKTPDTDAIPIFDVFQMEPWRLPGGGKFYLEKKFFFSHVIEMDDTRVAGTGQWRVVEKGKEIVDPTNKLTIGKRNTLSFWNGQGIQTNWIMHEFFLSWRIDPSEMSSWAVYRIFQKEEARKSKKTKPTVIDLSVESGNTSGQPTPLSL